MKISIGIISVADVTEWAWRSMPNGEWAFR